MKRVITDGWTVRKERKADKMDGQCEAKWPRKRKKIKKIGDDEWAKSESVK